MNAVVEYFLYPVSPILALFVGACLFIAAECVAPRSGRVFKFWLALATTFASGLFAFKLWKDLPLVFTSNPYPGTETWLRYFGEAYHLDPLTLALFAALTLFTALAFVFMELVFHKTESQSEVYILTLFIASGMMLLVSSANLLMAFLALELMSLPTYVLVGIQRRDRYSCEAALKYFLFGSFASVLFVLGVALLFGQFGTLRFSLISQALATQGLPTIYAKATVYSALSLITAASAFKVGAAPFHMWLPDAYQGAPTPVTGFMGSAIKMAGFGLMIRLLWDMFLPISQNWVPVISALAILTMFVGNLAALVQSNLKRLFAYSSISHAGYLLVGICSLSAQGPNPGPIYFYLIVYGLMFLGLFGCLTLIERATENTEVYQLSGLGFTHPVLGVCLAIFALSAAGIPPTAGFLSKYYIFLEAVKTGQVMLVVLAVLSSLIGVYYYLRVLVYLYMKESKQSVVIAGHGTSFAMAGILICAICMIYFTFSQAILRF